MKKARNLFMLAIAAFAFAACSGNDDVLPEGGGGKGNETEAGKAWLAIRLKTAGNTRSLNTPDQQNGTASESNVSEVKVLLFDTSLNLVEEIDLDGSQMGTPGQPEGIGGSAFKVSKTSAHILVVANPPTTFGGFADGAPYATINRALTSSADGVTIKDGTRNYFMMTNAHGYLAPTSDGTTLTTLSLSDSEAAAESSPLEINVDRVVAKVRVYSNAASANSNGIVGNIEWVLNVTNKKFFPASLRSKTWNEDPANTGDGARGTCITPFDKYKIGSYRTDPNFDNATSAWITVPATVPANQTAYNDNYYYFHDGAVPGATSGQGTPATGGNGLRNWNALSTAEYCLENTQKEEDNVHAYTTQVLVKAQFAPKEFANPNAVQATPNADATIDWMSIGNGVYTFTTLQAWLESYVTNKYTSATGTIDDYNIPLLASFNKGLDAIPATNIALPTEVEFNNNYGGDVNQVITAFKNSYSIAKTAIEGAGAGTYGPVKYYDGGENYYKIMIKHDNVLMPDGVTENPNVLNKLGEFGVVRNSVYDVTIGRILNAGFPSIPEPTPDTKDEDDDLWLAIKININPWTWYKQVEDL